MKGIDPIIRWAQQSPLIKALVLTGSRTNPNDTTDELSDFDLVVVTPDVTFIDNDDWLSNISAYWVCIRDKYELDGFVVPTRLVIFDAKMKVDFSFIGPDAIENFVRPAALPDGFGNGYHVLLDKGNLLTHLPPPDNTRYTVGPPTKMEFATNVREFWFEAWHVAKYLRRGDLVTARWRDWSTKHFLMQMLQWQHALTVGAFRPKPYGIGIEKWLTPSLLKKLHGCFAGISPADGWISLGKTSLLYREVASEVAQKLKFPYEKSLDENVSSFIKTLAEEKTPL
jgi:aminoglycoside 6-adenylyltransferase